MARILVVDNASFMRASLKYILENAGHQVVGTASDGDEAVLQYKSLKPDIVTMDILMEKMDGVQALQEIRKQDPNAIVIMVTAIGQEAKEAEARSKGASGYIRKPFKQSDVIAEIGRVLQVKAA